MGSDWMDIPDDRMTPVQKMLAELTLAYLAKTKRKRVQDKEIAKKIGIPPTTYAGYVNGDRSPALHPALLIADAFENLLGLEARGRWLETLGFPDYVVIRDPLQREIYRNLGHLPRRALEVIHEIITNPESIYDRYKPPGKDGDG